jgi:hypothetical protein
MTRMKLAYAGETGDEEDGNGSAWTSTFSKPPPNPTSNPTSSSSSSSTADSKPSKKRNNGEFADIFSPKSKK